MPLSACALPGTIADLACVLLELIVALNTIRVDAVSLSCTAAVCASRSCHCGMSELVKRKLAGVDDPLKVARLNSDWVAKRDDAVHC